MSLQRGVLKVEQKMLGIQCSSYSVAGRMFKTRLASLLRNVILLEVSG